MESLEKNIIFSIIQIVCIIATMICGMIIISLIGLIITATMGADAIAIAGIGATVLCTIVLPIISLIFVILSITAFKDSDSGQLTSNILNIVLTIVSIIGGIVWIGVMPLIPHAPEVDIHFATMQSVVLLAIILLAVIIVMAILKIVLKD